MQTPYYPSFVKRTITGNKSQTLLNQLRTPVLGRITPESIADVLYLNKTGVETKAFVDQVCKDFDSVVQRCFPPTLNDLSEIINWVNDDRVDRAVIDLKCFVLTFILKDLFDKRESKKGKLYADIISGTVNYISFSLIEICLKIYSTSGVGHTIDDKGTTFCQRVLSKTDGKYLSILTKKNKYGSFILREPNSRGQRGIYILLSHNPESIENAWVKSLLLQSYRNKEDDLEDCTGASVINGPGIKPGALIDTVSQIDDEDDGSVVDDDDDDESIPQQHETDVLNIGQYLGIRDRYQDLFAQCRDELKYGKGGVTIKKLSIDELFINIQNELESDLEMENEDIIKLRIGSFAVLAKFINDGILADGGLDKKSPGKGISEELVQVIFDHAEIEKEKDEDEDEDEDRGGGEEGGEEEEDRGGEEDGGGEEDEEEAGKLVMVDEEEEWKEAGKLESAANEDNMLDNGVEEIEVEDNNMLDNGVEEEEEYD